MKIVFRLDSSDIIGYGHIYRCQTLATLFQERGHEVHFITRDFDSSFKKLSPSIIEHKLPYQKSNSVNKNDYSTWFGTSKEKDLSQTLAILKSLEPVDIVICDHYAIDSQYEIELKKLTKIVSSIEDLEDRPHSCDVLINQNSHVQEEVYSSLCPRETKLLLGSKYSILREDFFQDENRKSLPIISVENIFIHLGTVSIQYFGPLLEGLKQSNLSEKQITLVLPEQVAKKEKELSEIINSFKNLSRKIFIQDMAGEMSKCDMAIGAVGSSTWERATLFIPSLCVSVAENQVPIAKGAHEKNFCEYIGDIKDLSSEDWRKQLNLFSSDLNRMNQIKDSCKKFFVEDGKENIYNELISCLKS